MKKLLYTFIILMGILLLPCFSVIVSAKENVSEEIEQLVMKTMQKAQLPGVSVVVINQGDSSYYNYGYTRKGTTEMISENTLFELGSMSKSFTALGILFLEQEGYLSLDDDICDYLPWLKMNYKGASSKLEDTKLTISNFLYHTSGVPYDTIGRIPAGDTTDMLEKTVRGLIGMELDFRPGTEYSYSSINYDVLALVIEKVTGDTYEAFMEENIIMPLGLNDTYFFRDDDIKDRIAAGHKVTMFIPREYEAPVYRGNTAAGYIISSTRDMERWMRIQLGLIDIGEPWNQLLRRSHEGDTSVPSHGKFYYAGGWQVHIQGSSIAHGGTNPNYSSMMILKPESATGVCVLTNTNSGGAEYLAENILNILYGEPVYHYKSDSYKTLDTVFCIIFILGIAVSLFYLFLIIRSAGEIKSGKRKGTKMSGGKVTSLALSIPLIAYAGFCVYYLPNILFGRIPWNAVAVWGSEFCIYGSIVGYLAFVLVMIYILLTFHFQKDGEINYLALVPLSLLNGLASALIIFSINYSFNMDLKYSREALVYFVLALAYFVYTIKLIRGWLIVVSNEIIYRKRTEIVDLIINTDFEQVEALGQEKIFSGLNNDINEISKIPQIGINMASNSLTLLFCLIYLFMKNPYAFWASAVVIGLNGVLSIITGRLASKYWEENRNLQDIYYRQLSDLVYGFKELLLCVVRRKAFLNELKKYSALSAEYNKRASIKFLNYEMYNVLMYNLMFGVVVFLFPLAFSNFNVSALYETLLIVFYMTGPFNALVNGVPQITQLRVNLKRINALEKSLSNEPEPAELRSSYRADEIKIELDDVQYTYRSNDGNNGRQEFTLGPVNTSFSSGEVVYIVGGNGCGKSTLGKILSGLYKPQSGTIRLNGEEIGDKELNNLFSAIYSDYHLFDRLYGFDYTKEKPHIDELLKLMNISHAVDIHENGEFSSLDLSSGQKKRLGFVICMLENKPMLLFDEWAAEQDPQFREFFYTIVLPELKAEGKGIVVITHDDRYFHMADRVIKLEYGGVV